MISFDDLASLVEVADTDDLRLRAPVSGSKFSPDVMEKKTGRPPVGVQGMILDAMDDEAITRSQATILLDRVNKRLRGECPGLSFVGADGELVPLAMEAFHGARP